MDRIRTRPQKCKCNRGNSEIRVRVCDAPDDLSYFVLRPPIAGFAGNAAVQVHRRAELSACPLGFISTLAYRGCRLVVDEFDGAVTLPLMGNRSEGADRARPRPAGSHAHYPAAWRRRGGGILLRTRQSQGAMQTRPATSDLGLARRPLVPNIASYHGRTAYRTAHIHSETSIFSMSSAVRNSHRAIHRTAAIRGRGAWR